MTKRERAFIEKWKTEDKNWSNSADRVYWAAAFEFKRKDDFINLMLMSEEFVKFGDPDGASYRFAVTTLR